MIKIRQPLQATYINVVLPWQFLKLIAEEVNVEKVICLENNFERGLLKYLNTGECLAIYEREV